MTEQTRREVMADAWNKLEASSAEPGEKHESESKGETNSGPERKDNQETTQISQEDSSGSGSDSQEIEQRAAEHQERDGSDKKSVPDTKKEVKAEKKEEKEDKIGPRAPAAWNNAERAHWDKLPKEAKAAIARREKEIVSVLQDSAGARQFVRQFLDVVNPFAHIIRAQHSTPLDAVHNLMQTAAGLATGNPQQKATILAEICENYGVDLKVLDKVLFDRIQGNAQNPNAGRGTVDPNVLQMLAPVNQFMQEVANSRQLREKELMMEAESQVADFGAGVDYFEDLREEMADYVDFCTSKNKKISIQQAYEFVLQQHPEMYKDVMTKRKEASGEISKNQQTLEKARRAASSISGAPNNGAGGKQPTTRREHLAAAWENLSTK